MFRSAENAPGVSHLSSNDQTPLCLVANLSNSLLTSAPLSQQLQIALIGAWGSWSWYFTVANDWETDRTVDWETDGTVALLSSGKGGSSEACHRQISWQRGIRNRQMIKTSLAQSHPIPTQPFVLFVVLETILSSDSHFLDFYLAMVIERQQTRS